MANKQKTHKGTKKVLTVRPGGTIKFKHTEGNHHTAKDTAKSKRQRRKNGNLSKGINSKLVSVIK